MAVLYILLNLDAQRSLAFNTKPAIRWPSLNLGRLNLTGRENVPVDDQTARVSNYLEDTLQLLRFRDTRQLSPEKQKQRSRLLSLLDQYRAAREYPDRFDYMGYRRLVFQDTKGRLSALGHLIRKTAGTHADDLIEVLLKAKSVKEVFHPKWIEWVDRSGFTADELTML